MRALVCGGRNYADYTLLKEVLDGFENFKGEKITTVIHGAARGADTLAGRWARETGRQVEIYPANWKEHGKAAGPIRNREMLVEGRPEVVIAFPGGSGTANMVSISKKAGVTVIEVGK